jgi:hypothetical protein
LSVAVHVHHMKTEAMKAHPNIDAIIDKMKRTIPYRRKFCLENGTAGVLQEFPALRHRQLVCMHNKLQMCDWFCYIQGLNMLLMI